MIARYREGVVPEAEVDPALAAVFAGLVERGRAGCSTARS